MSDATYKPGFPLDLQRQPAASLPSLPTMFSQSADLGQFQGPPQQPFGAFPQQALPQQPAQPEDPLDAFVNWQAQQVQIGSQPPENLGFLQTLKSAKDADPSTFYSILAAFARNDYEGIQNLAMQVRQSRQATQARREQELSRMAQYRAQRRESVEGKEEYRQQLATQRTRDSLERAGLLQRVEDSLGRPIDTYADALEAQRAASKLRDSDKFQDEKTKFLTAVSRGTSYATAAGGRVKRAITPKDPLYDPDFAASVSRAEKSRSDWDAARAENMKERNARMKELRASAAQLPPHLRLQFTAALASWREAEDDIDSAQRTIVENEFLSGVPEGQNIIRSAEEKMSSASSKRDAALGLIDEIIRQAGAPPQKPRVRIQVGQPQNISPTPAGTAPAPTTSTTYEDILRAVQGR